MKFKLDECLGRILVPLFAERGHDCATAGDEGLLGVLDDGILEAAVAEHRVLVTADQDFGNVFAYPPQETAGIVVFNLPARSSRKIMRILAEALLSAPSEETLSGRLWIVEPGGIRIYEPEEEGDRS